jgi:hypothetical protein
VPGLGAIIAQVVAAIISTLFKGWNDRQADIAKDRAMLDLGASTSIIKGQNDELLRIQDTKRRSDHLRGVSDDELDEWL